MNFHFLTALQNAPSLKSQSPSDIRDFHAPQSRFNAKTQRGGAATKEDRGSRIEDGNAWQTARFAHTRNLLKNARFSTISLQRRKDAKHEGNLIGADGDNGKGNLRDIHNHAFPSNNPKPLNPPPRKPFSFRKFQTPRSAFRAPHSESGIALVITLILLSVIPFMAVTFLVVSRRERGAVTTM